MADRREIAFSDRMACTAGVALPQTRLRSSRDWIAGLQLVALLYRREEIVRCQIGNLGRDRFLTMKVMGGRLYNRAFNAAEVWSLYTKPFLEFRRPQLFVKAPAAVGVTPLFRMLMGVGQ